MNVLEVQNLTKSFGTLNVLRDVSLSVSEGEKIAIIGGSGCGKSVFLRSIELLEKPDAGRIWIDGQEITSQKANVDLIRRNIGMVYQKFNLFTNMTVMDNLCLAPVKLLGMERSEAEQKAISWLRQVGLANRAYDYPAVLSGGQQQRIAICRCLMMDPKILLFDEPTSALDPTMVGEVLAVIRMLAKRGMTMIVVTHEMNFAREVADRVLFFADGGVYEEGTPDEIFDRPRKEKTIAFIRKIKQFDFQIESFNFDLMQLHGGIQYFGEKYAISQSVIYRLQICCEELIYEMLNHCYASGEAIDAAFSISYSETEKSVEIEFQCDGKQYNPFNNQANSEEGIGITILKKIAQSTSVMYKDRNIINIVV